MVAEILAKGWVDSFELFYSLAHAEGYCNRCIHILKLGGHMSGALGLLQYYSQKYLCSLTNWTYKNIDKL